MIGVLNCPLGNLTTHSINHGMRKRIILTLSLNSPYNWYTDWKFLLKIVKLRARNVHLYFILFTKCSEKKNNVFEENWHAYVEYLYLQGWILRTSRIAWWPCALLHKGHSIRIFYFEFKLNLTCCCSTLFPVSLASVAIVSATWKSKSHPLSCSHQIKPPGL